MYAVTSSNLSVLCASAVEDSFQRGGNSLGRFIYYIRMYEVENPVAR